MKKRIISFILILAAMFSIVAVTASAATEEFISEVALVYRDSPQEAQKAIEGTDWKLFAYDLNPGADYWFDDGVYLVYKTSTNVEDAITDLRVMDMYGGYSVSSYEDQLEKTRASYISMIGELRRAAAEFKELYNAGDAMALLAYRQMNYYKDMKTEGGAETDLAMGDFFLNLPTDDKIVQVMMEGNTYVVVNLITLLAIGISGQDENTLSSKVAELYAVKDTLTDLDYYDDGLNLYKALDSVRAKLLRYDALLDEYNLEDDEMSDDEYVFLSENAAIALLLGEIKLGETSLADLLRGGEYEVSDLYPIVAALSAGQKSLIKMGQLETVLKYNAPSKPIEELNSLLDDIEVELKNDDGEIEPIDVYLGVDRSIFKGVFAMTNAAERQQALTGKTWDEADAAAKSMPFIIASAAIAGVGAITAGALMVIGVKFIKTKISAAALKASAYLQERLDAATLVSDFTKAWAPTVKILAGVTVAALLIAGGIYHISTWYNYYNPDYTVIPDTMIDVRETDIGEKYIKYTAAKVVGTEDDMNADLNAYQGKEWNALYYTKDATAGNCLLPKFVYSVSSSTVARRHQGISMFGETEAFDLNSHVYNAGANSVYVTVRYSTTLKSGANVPSVVGSMFAAGAVYTLTALTGAGIGTGALLLVQRTRGKSKDEADSKDSGESDG